MLTPLQVIEQIFKLKQVREFMLLCIEKLFEFEKDSMYMDEQVD